MSWPWYALGGLGVSLVTALGLWYNRYRNAKLQAATAGQKTMQESFQLAKERVEAQEKAQQVKNKIERAKEIENASKASASQLADLLRQRTGARARAAGEVPSPKNSGESGS